MSFGIRNKRELMAAIACYWLVAFGFWMVTHQQQFSGFVMGALP